MSIILKALRRSEQERLKNQPASLEHRILESQDTIEKKQPIWLTLLIAINIVFLSYIIWSFNKVEENKITTAKKPAIVKKEKLIQEKINTPLPPANKIVEKKPVISIAEQLKAPQKNAKPISVATTFVANQNIQQKTAKINPEKQTAVIKTHTLPIKTGMLPSHQTIKVEAKTKANQPPFLSELNYKFRRTVPSININVFVYAEHKQDRFIMVNMKKYLTGQYIDSGMKLIDIRINSLVVEYNNKIFQIKRK